MKKRRHDKLISFLAGCVLLTFHTLLFSWVWFRVYNPKLPIPYQGRGSYVLIFLFFLFLLTCNQIFGGLRLGYYKVLDSVVARSLSTLCAYAVSYFIISLISYQLVNPLSIVTVWIIGIAFNIGWTGLSNYVYYKVNPPRQMLLIYGDSSIDEVYSKISARSEKYEIIGHIPHTLGEEKLKERIKGQEAVILHDLSAELRNHLIKYCYEESIRVYVTPKLYDIMIRGAADMDLFDTPFLLMRNRGLTPLQAFSKRSLDIIISLCCLVITSPILLLIIIAMKLFDKGPVLYRQTRLTLNGKEFQILKFRSMYEDAEKDSIRLMSKGDDRITPIGRVLRRTHLDELPQLFNIIKGDMSFVGPRPERPEIATVYMQQIPEFSYRLKMKAGLTGYAQVYGKYNSTPYDKLKLDLTYIQNYSFFLDIKLLLLTGKTLFIPDHAEGISAAFQTALREEVAVTGDKQPKEEKTQ